MVQVSQQAIAEPGAQTKHNKSQYMLIKSCCFLLPDEGLCVHFFNIFCSDSAVDSKMPWDDRTDHFLHPVSPFTLFSPVFCLRIPPGSDNGDDDRVLPLYLHHSGNVPCLLMQIESCSFSSPYCLSFWWIAANCQWGLDPVHNINFVWQAGGIMESSVCWSKHSAYSKANRSHRGGSIKHQFEAVTSNFVKD